MSHREKPRILGRHHVQIKPLHVHNIRMVDLLYTKVLLEKSALQYPFQPMTQFRDVLDRLGVFLESVDTQISTVESPISMATEFVGEEIVLDMLLMSFGIVRLYHLFLLDGVHVVFVLGLPPQLLYIGRVSF